jgi:hypothetical protein
MLTELAQKGDFNQVLKIEKLKPFRVFFSVENF